jgi:hypothetical protein
MIGDMRIMIGVPQRSATSVVVAVRSDMMTTDGPVAPPNESTNTHPGKGGHRFVKELT